MKMPVPTEEEEQKAFILHCKERRIKVIAVPNGMYCGQGAGRFGYIKKQKSLGLSTGFPDLIIFAKNSTSEVLFIEMKRQKGGKLSDEQEKQINELDIMGYFVGIAKGCNEAIIILNKYLEM